MGGISIFHWIIAAPMLLSALLAVTGVFSPLIAPAIAISVAQVH